LSGIPGLFVEELTGIVPADQPVFTSAVTFPFGPVDRGDPAELVVGSGTWNQLFSLPFPSLTVKQSPAPVLVPGMIISGSSVTTYTYTPAIAAVPEPRSSGLLALLFGFGFAARNWRARRAAQRVSLNCKSLVPQRIHRIYARRLVSGHVAS